MHELEAIIEGRVQKVMYRDFTRRSARRLRLTGTVENLPDGTVRVVAQGAEAALRSLLEKLETGPLLAKVEKVTVSWRQPSLQFASFDIVYRSLLDRL